MRELQYNDFNGSTSTSNRYSYSTNLSHYFSYNNISHPQQQQQGHFKRFSSRSRQLLRSHRYSQQNQENNPNKVSKKTGSHSILNENLIVDKMQSRSKLVSCFIKMCFSFNINISKFLLLFFKTNQSILILVEFKSKSLTIQSIII